MRYTIDEIGKNKESLFEANKKADEETVESGKIYTPNLKFPLAQGVGNFARDFKFKGVEIKFEDSEISGAKKIIYGKKPLDITIPQYDNARITKETSPPLFYIVPPQWIEVIKRLDYHGVKYSKLKEAREIEVESYRFEEPKWATRPFEGRLTMSFKTVPIKEKRIFPKNSVIVPLNQKDAKVAIHWLEPNSPDSAMYWGVFNSIFEQKEYSESYIMEEIAKEMLAKDEKLRMEFQERLKDEKFAKSPRARLRFFYVRSPYYDKRIGVYPVGRIVSRIKF